MAQETLTSLPVKSPVVDFFFEPLDRALQSAIFQAVRRQTQYCRAMPSQVAGGQATRATPCRRRRTPGRWSPRLSRQRLRPRLLYPWKGAVLVPSPVVDFFFEPLDRALQRAISSSTPAATAGAVGSRASVLGSSPLCSSLLISFWYKVRTNTLREHLSKSGRSLRHFAGGSASRAPGPLHVGGAGHQEDDHDRHCAKDFGNVQSDTLPLPRQRLRAKSLVFIAKNMGRKKTYKCCTGALPNS